MRRPSLESYDMRGARVRHGSRRAGALGPATHDHLTPEQVTVRARVLRDVLAADGVRSAASVARGMGLDGEALQQVLDAYEAAEDAA